MTDDKLADEMERECYGGRPENIRLDWDQCHQIITALRRQPSSDKVLMPREPTQEMIEAFHKSWSEITMPAQTRPQRLIDAYRAMLAAAEAEGIMSETREWRVCKHHPYVNPETMWGCPDCIVELRRALAQAQARCAELEGFITSSDGRFLALEKDAARYRWLRETMPMTIGSALKWPYYPAQHDYDVFDAKIDAAIDAALKEPR